MKKKLVALGLALSLTAGVPTANAATGLQLDPTGTGSIGSSEIFQSLSGLGNMLFDSLMAPATSGVIFAHNAFSPLAGIPGAELTYVFDLPVTSSIVNLGVGASLSGAGAFIEFLNAGGGTFSLYFDSASVRSEALGTGYTDGVLIASGDISIDTNVGFAVGNNSGGAVVAGAGSLDANADGFTDLASNNTTPTIRSNGATTLVIDITSQDDSYVVNDLVNADPLMIDMLIETLGTTTPFGSALASATVNGATLDAGADGVNDFVCGASLGDCDMQVQISGLMTFNAETVPEPAPLALLGLGLSLLVLQGRRKSRKHSA